jgi:hypothetical protein
MYACADRFCTSGLLVGIEGAVCIACAASYEDDFHEEDEVTVAFKHSGKDTEGYF